MQFFRFIVLVIIGVCGCRPPSDSRHQTLDGRPATSSANILDETEILAIAREAVATNDTWVERAEFQAPKRQPDGSWSVQVWRLPKTPGGSRLILIDSRGTVTSYDRGE